MERPNRDIVPPVFASIAENRRRRVEASVAISYIEREKQLWLIDSQAMFKKQPEEVTR
jgi:hypothetical protein